MLLYRISNLISFAVPLIILSMLPDCNTITDQDFENILFNEQITVHEITSQNQSWELIKTRIDQPFVLVEKDEFIEQSKTVYLENSFFRYSDYGTPGDFTITNVTLAGPEILFKLKGKTIRVGDSIDTITNWPHTMDNETSKIHLHIFATDSSGRILKDNENTPVRSDYLFLSFIFDETNQRITEINFMWRIV